jgi:hypothetical protein
MEKQKTPAPRDLKTWLAIRKRAGLKIGPKTAEITWKYAQVLDPYGLHPDPPKRDYQVGREYFARGPESDIWVWFGDLTNAKINALKRRLS